MRFTYIKNDKIVGVDGVFYTIDNLNISNEISAIQWYDTYGEIEFADKINNFNEIFDNISLIQPLIDEWNIQNEKYILSKSTTVENNNIQEFRSFEELEKLQITE